MGLCGQEGKPVQEGLAALGKGGGTALSWMRHSLHGARPLHGEPLNLGQEQSPAECPRAC